MAATHLGRLARGAILPLALVSICLSQTTAIAPAQAAMTVIDPKAIAEAQRQLSELKKQLEEMQEMKARLEDQLNAIGQAGEIAIPIFNAAKMGSQLGKDANCLLPDLSRLMPDVEFDELDFGSICEAGNAYRGKLWISPEALTKMSWNKKNEQVFEIRNRRENVLVDAASKGLGQADIAQKMAADANQAAAEIEAAADKAKDTNTRLTVLTKAMAAQMRVQAQTNQILAQQLKVQSAFAIATGVQMDNILAEEDDDKKKGETE